MANAAKVTWQKRVAKWRASGETAAVFAAREGIKVGTLRWWSSRLQRGVTTASAPAPIPIACADHPWGRVGAYIRAGGPALPPWLAEIKPHLHAWRSADRFRKLAQRWRVARFHGDEVGYEALDAWRYRDNHLEPYETGMRRRALLRRREGYRILASNLCQRYRTLVIDDTDLAELKRSPAPESEEVDGIPLVKNNQSLVAGSELRQVLMNAFHGRVEKMSSNDVTRRCYSCGHVDEAWDQSVNTGRERTCPACGLRVDQDANACRNLLLEWANAQETPETARTAKSAIAKPSRSQRLRTARSASTTTRPLET